MRSLPLGPTPSESPSAPARDRPASIAGAFLDVCRRTPDKPCLLFEGETYSYAHLREEVVRWARALRSWGVQPGDRAALFLENSPTFVAAYLGAHLAGAIVVLVNTQYRQVELRHILGDAEARLCITGPSGRAELERVVADLPALEAVVVVRSPLTPSPSPTRGEGNDDAAGAALTPPLPSWERGLGGEGAPRIYDADSFLALAPADPAERGRMLLLPEPDSVALIAYTSGTTGRSKGATLTHANLVANSIAVTTAWCWTEDDRLLLALPLFHVHGLGVGIHGALLTGSTVDLRRRFDAAEVYDTLLRGETTMFFGVPTMYTRLIAEARGRTERPAPIRLYVSGSAPLSVQTFEEFEELFGQRILERYGMTETIMNLTNPYDDERRPGTVGQPFPGQEARIVDVRTRQPILDETPGEIQVRGPHVFKGYWRRPEATAEAFDSEGWFNTGDLGWRSADGYNTISGRARELIISGGYNIYPREVEEVLLTHPGVAEAAVVGLPDPEFGEQVVVAIVPRTPSGASTGLPAAAAGQPSAEELIAYCRDHLASYKKPRRIVFVDSLPRNALGKIQKHLLRNSLLSGSPQ